MMAQNIPGVALSSDMISGFCGETEGDHADTLSLMAAVRYEAAFMFAYSMRERTHAYHKLEDDVAEAVKQRRLREVCACMCVIVCVRVRACLCVCVCVRGMRRARDTARAAQVIDTFRTHAAAKNQLELGALHLVLIDGRSKRSESQFSGRTDTNKRVFLPAGVCRGRRACACACACMRA